jgi:hypothetical protein
MKKHSLIVAAFLFCVILLSACSTVSTSSKDEVKQQLQGREVIVFGEKDFVRNAAKDLKDLGVIVETKDNYALALSAAANDDIVEIHCINKADGQQITVQASHAAEMYVQVTCTNGVIFRNFVTTQTPDMFFD